MSYYKITVDYYEDDNEKYKSSEIYKQEVEELNLQAVIRAVNHIDGFESGKIIPGQQNLPTAALNNNDSIKDVA